MTLLFQPLPATLAKTSAGDEFPVRRIFCVGRNYAEHAREMGKDPDRDPPFFFTKWAETVVASGQSVAYPPRHIQLSLRGRTGGGHREIRQQYRD